MPFDHERYQIVRQLGRGGMGVVFEAMDSYLERRVALKLLNAQLSFDDDFRTRFRREAALLARLDSSHIVRVYDVGESDGSLFMVTQLIDGGDLHQHLRSHGPLSVPLALDVTDQLCSALSHAHAMGVIHRDIKPSNVLVRRESERLHCFLGDFGIATTLDTSMTIAGGVLGSPAYLAPERSSGAPATVASDVYALGCQLWALVRGHPPFGGNYAQVVAQHAAAPRPRLPGSGPAVDSFNEVMARALAVDPRDRPVSALALAQDLRRVAAQSWTTMSAWSPTNPDLLVESVTRFGEQTMAAPSPPERAEPTPAPDVAATLARTPSPDAAPTLTDRTRPDDPPGPPDPPTSHRVPVTTLRFTAEQSERVESALLEARRLTGVSFSIYLGPTYGAPRQHARRLHASLLAPDVSVLLLIDPAIRAFELVTGSVIRGRMDDQAARRIVDDMMGRFRSGQFTDGLIAGIWQMKEALS